MVKDHQPKRCPKWVEMNNGNFLKECKLGLDLRLRIYFASKSRIDRGNDRVIASLCLNWGIGGQLMFLHASVEPGL